MKSGTIVRAKKRPGQFALIHRGFLSDVRLGLDAMGLLAWLLAKPDDWFIQVSHVASSTGSAIGRVRSCMRKLEAAGYLRRSPVRDRRTGRIARWEVAVFETPEAAARAEVEAPGLFEKIEAKKNGRRPGTVSETAKRRFVRAAASERGSSAPSDSDRRFQSVAPFVGKPGGGDPVNGKPSSGDPFDGEARLLRTNETKSEGTEERGTDGEEESGARSQENEKNASDEGTKRCSDGRKETGDRSQETGGGIAISDLRFANDDGGVSGGPRDGGGVVVGDEGQVVSSLVERAYFPVREARGLVERYGVEACERGLMCLAGARRRPVNVRGFVMQAVKEGWEPTGRTKESGARRQESGGDASGGRASDEATQSTTRGRSDEGRVCDEEARVRAEVAEMDAGLAGLSEGEWAVHVAEIRPTLGVAMVRMLEGGRRAWEIRSVRGMVWERVKVSQASSTQ